MCGLALRVYLGKVRQKDQKCLNPLGRVLFEKLTVPYPHILLLEDTS
jgi:hypothetical protein